MDDFRKRNTLWDAHQYYSYIEDYIVKFADESNLIEGVEDIPENRDLYTNQYSICNVIRNTPKRDLIIFLRSEGVKFLHEKIMQSKPDIFPGELRQNFVSVSGKIKMPPLAVRYEFEKWDEFDFKCKTEEECYAQHLYFEHIHPFTDGNGRTGRMWWNILRLYNGFDWETIENKNKEKYYLDIVEWELKHEKMIEMEIRSSDEFDFIMDAYKHRDALQRRLDSRSFSIA